VGDLSLPIIEVAMKRIEQGLASMKMSRKEIHDGAAAGVRMTLFSSSCLLSYDLPSI
jgi:hypothetical protein